MKKIRQINIGDIFLLEKRIILCTDDAFGTCRSCCFRKTEWCGAYSCDIFDRDDLSSVLFRDITNKETLREEIRNIIIKKLEIL